MPELPSADDDQDGAADEDESDRLRKLERQEAQQEELRLRLRSQVLKRDLPRPYSISKGFSDYQSKFKDPYLKQADELLRAELVSFITHETLTYPFREARMRTTPSAVTNFDEFSEEELNRARSL